MSQFFQIHPENPQPRLVKQAVEIVRQGGVIVYPTDSSYALGCRIGEKTAVDRIRRIRQLDDKHNFTLVCRDLSELGVYAKVDTGLFRLHSGSAVKIDNSDKPAEDIALSDFISEQGLRHVLTSFDQHSAKTDLIFT